MRPIKFFTHKDIYYCHPGRGDCVIIHLNVISTEGRNLKMFILSVIKISQSLCSFEMTHLMGQVLRDHVLWDRHLACQ
jgi:hypothetical protein